MKVERIRIVRITEATAVWLAVSAVFILVPLPDSFSGLVVVYAGAVLVEIIAVAVVSSLLLERRLPQLWMSGPRDGRATVVMLAVGAAAFVTLLGVWASIGHAPRTMWIVYMGMTYAMTVAGILARRQLA
jgi:hypothetical protein